MLTQAVLSDKSVQRTQARLGRLVERFEPISLSAMKNVSLLNRTDTKYVMSASQLCSALARLSERYRVLDIDATRLNHYQTLYFDTQDLALYRRHHDGGRNRYKVRYREYVDSHLFYLEVKYKTNKNRTIKSRLRTPGVTTEFGARGVDFVRAHFPYDVGALGPTLLNDFLRITLVSKFKVERLTLDVNLQFRHGGAGAALPGVAIAEVKQQGFSLQSDFIRQMRALDVRSTGFSKYCMGISMLYEGVKRNNFKPRELLVKKIMQREAADERVH